MRDFLPRAEPTDPYGCGTYERRNSFVSSRIFNRGCFHGMASCLSWEGGIFSSGKLMVANCSVNSLCPGRYSPGHQMGDGLPVEQHSPMVNSLSVTPTRASVRPASP